MKLYIYNESRCDVANRNMLYQVCCWTFFDFCLIQFISVFHHSIALEKQQTKRKHRITAAMPTHLLLPLDLRITPSSSKTHCKSALSNLSFFLPFLLDIFLLLLRVVVVVVKCGVNGYGTNFYHVHVINQPIRFNLMCA